MMDAEKTTTTIVKEKMTISGILDGCGLQSIYCWGFMTFYKQIKAGISATSARLRCMVSRGKSSQHLLNKQREYKARFRYQLGSETIFTHGSWCGCFTEKPTAAHNFTSRWGQHGTKLSSKTATPLRLSFMITGVRIHLFPSDLHSPYTVTLRSQCIHDS